MQVLRTAKRLAPLLALTLAPQIVRAETPMTAADFEAHVTGMTITYQRSGGIFGIEEYLPGRKVRWSVAPGDCKYGSWYPQADAICFVYEYDPTPHCWSFWMQGGVMMARSASAVPGADLSETGRSASPLPCPGPDVGV